MVEGLKVRDNRRRYSSNPKIHGYMREQSFRQPHKATGRGSPRRCETPDNGSGTKEEMRFDHRHKTKPGIWLLVPPVEVLVCLLWYLRRRSS